MGTLPLNDFKSIVGSSSYSLALQFTVTTNIIKGKTYAFRYRAVNKVGAGGWSPISEIVAATVPSPPPFPIYVSSDDTSISLMFSPSTDNGGSKILGYKIMRDTVDLTSTVAFEEVTYNNVASTFTISSLTAGMKYRKGGSFITVFDGAYPPSITYFKKAGLKNGL
jgi:hypothetical protein